MSKHWTPGRKSVAVRPSRIRRDPVRLESPVRPLTKAEIEKAEARARELEIWGGVAGVVLFAAALVAVIVGISIATYFQYDPAAAAKAARFGQCYNSDGTNCVLDGDTIYAEGEKLTIAGMDAPQILGARCGNERDRGIDAAVRLQDLLNSGKVTVSRAFRDEFGRDVRTVKVDGRDVGAAMVDAGVAREFDGTKHDWCGAADDEQG